MKNKYQFIRYLQFLIFSKKVINNEIVDKYFSSFLRLNLLFSIFVIPLYLNYITNHLNLKIMDKGLKVIAIVSKALNSTNNGISFFSINNYTNAQGEVSNRVINIGQKLSNAKKKDAIYLENLDVKTLDSSMDIAILEDARVKLLEALVNPTQATKNRSKAQVQTYTKINDAVKYHNETKAIYVYGMLVKNKNGDTKKEVLVKGDYKASTKKPLTQAKDVIRENLKASQYQMFKVEVQPEQVTYSGGSDTILIEMV